MMKSIKYVAVSLVFSILIGCNGTYKMNVASLKESSNEIEDQQVCITGWYKFNLTGGVLYVSEEDMERDNISNGIHVEFSEDISTERVYKFSGIDRTEASMCGIYESKALFSLGKLMDVDK